MNFKQQPHTLLMVRPKAFGYNAQTESSNAFQQKGDSEKVLQEFDRMTSVLRSHDIAVTIIEDTNSPIKPDAIFPNNWISFHEDGSIVLYPMMAENRRWERRNDIVDLIKNLFDVRSVLDLSAEENHRKYLEGTGSLVFDHTHNIAYACRSPRTDETLVNLICKKLDYRPIIFDAADGSNKPIYHTNLLLAVAEKFVIVCLDAIGKESDQEMLLEIFRNTEKKVIAISFEQMARFAGNAIEVSTTTGENFLLMSESGFHALLPGQINAITTFVEIVPLSIPSIEKIGGGSVRCMVAGVHLPKQKIAL